MSLEIDAAQERREKIPGKKLIWTPDHPFFYEVLHEHCPPMLRPDALNLCVRADTGILEPMTDEEVVDYLLGGEYEEVMEDQEDFFEWEDFSE